MRHLFVLILSMACASLAIAEGDSMTCDAAATAKKLSGPAKTAFVTRCLKDTLAACETQADSRKLTGTAKASDVKQCIRAVVD